MSTNLSKLENILEQNKETLKRLEKEIERLKVLAELPNARCSDRPEETYGQILRNTFFGSSSDDGSPEPGTKPTRQLPRAARGGYRYTKRRTKTKKPRTKTRTKTKNTRTKIPTRRR